MVTWRPAQGRWRSAAHLLYPPYPPPHPNRPSHSDNDHVTFLSRTLYLARVKEESRGQGGVHALTDIRW